eukprot:TRINITY_DN4369_c0_g1_i13.p1 TRINITY_DN4369_c0_g1~~TRINITY_DN4369_c0_g1_i13.p1  ORF type:complete len:207 (-),score=63.97 TRINITY_DN4369_c0_g1_i13:243-863(-)
MTDTPPGGSSSWVDLTRESSNNPFASPPGPSSPRRTTPVPFNVDNDYLKMLREAQRENSARSSARVSPISSAMMSMSSTCKNTPSASPKSPPNSPNTELANYEENLRGVVVNREPDIQEDINAANWRSRPNLYPPRGGWRFATNTSSKTSSGTQSDSEERKSEKPELRNHLTALIASNLLSLVLGAAVGYWLFRRSAAGNLVKHSS